MGSSNKNLLYLIGCLLLLHSGYSSHEFHKLSTSLHKKYTLPLDISLEAVVAFIFILIASIVSIENPKHLTIDDEVVREELRFLKPIEMKDSVQLGEVLGVNEFENLLSRVPFIDVTKMRLEYANWASNK